MVKVSPLEHVSHIVEAWKNHGEEFSGGEVLNLLIALDEYIYNPSFSCEEKKKALKLLWENKDILEEFEFEDEKAPLSHWWWHPKLWSKNIDIYEVLNDVCSEDKSPK